MLGMDKISVAGTAVKAWRGSPRSGSTPCHTNRTTNTLSLGTRVNTINNSRRTICRTIPTTPREQAEGSRSMTKESS